MLGHISNSCITMATIPSNKTLYSRTNSVSVKPLLPIGSRYPKETFERVEVMITFLGVKKHDSK